MMFNCSLLLFSGSEKRIVAIPIQTPGNYPEESSQYFCLVLQCHYKGSLGLQLYYSDLNIVTNFSCRVIILSLYSLMMEQQSLSVQDYFERLVLCCNYTAITQSGEKNTPE